MKRIALAAAALALAVPAFAQMTQTSTRGEAKATVAGKVVSIDYGRPSLKGRDMLAQAKIGEPWRMGSDAATSLKTEADLSFGTVSVPKGEYVLKATKVTADQWQLNVLAKADSAKVADIPLTTSTVADSVETLTVDLKGEKNKGEFAMTWGTTALKATFTAK
jgi:hypothetical protein